MTPLLYRSGQSCAPRRARRSPARVSGRPCNTGSAGIAVGMAAAVAVDATLIRCVLVPAVLALLGRKAWWIPGWLARVTPPLSLEGEAWFERRGAAALAEPVPAAAVREPEPAR
jgi:hypothetical protein